MNRRDALKQLAALAALASPVAGAWAAEETFQVLNPPQATDDPSKIEVVEFFHYGCPHCRNFDPLLESWLKKLPQDVAFRRIPAIWNNQQLAGLARLYYAAEVSGDLHALHGKVFAAVQDEKRPLHTEAGVSEWIQGKVVDPKKFMDAYKSFGVNSMLQRADQRARDMKIQGVPTLAIDGKFLTSASMAGSHEAALKKADELIARARRERAK
ncbi:thiol:disulfide interchange protein DsbA/DsbL [Thauera sp. 2A1]|uniref:thiol:disulfide interchange protein DsbA/DsbL n=1 Tax=Thauera sp. 2A1 TaxID=2570191 RepID=UPI001292A9FD|nr:thiol:disulfide interchange protein DsbA/DsbL [Thauera sp. 2A1]KAI5915485.1 thiol:disulfide interchange protein DsbA/DsbL [Thauera sp. 2A1]